MNVYAKFRNIPLRINKAFGIFRKVVTRRRTTTVVEIWDPSRIKKNVFLSTNVILRAISCFVRGCFAIEWIINMVFELRCIKSKCGAKDALWQIFSLLLDW